MAPTKWAIMVCLNPVEDDWIYVTEDTGECDWNLKPVLFDDIQDAFKYSDTLRLPGKEQNVQVVAYDE